MVTEIEHQATKTPASVAEALDMRCVLYIDQNELSDIGHNPITYLQIADILAI